MIENIGVIQEKTGLQLEFELKNLGVTKILYFVAKGWRGHVFKVRIGTKIAALKISTQERILRESSVLKKANKQKVGPKIYGVTTHCVAMQFIYGKRYPEFIENATKKDARQAVIKILKQAEKLDKAGVDHGELSRADKHIIIRKIGKNTKPYFIDFEKGSFVRKPHNFGSVLNYLFLNPHSFPARKTREKLNIRRTEVVKHVKSREWKQGNNWTRSWARFLKPNK